MKRQHHSETVSHIFQVISESNERYARLIGKHDESWVDLKKFLLTKTGEIEIAKSLRPHIFMTEPRQWAKRCYDKGVKYLGVDLTACYDLVKELKDKKSIALDDRNASIYDQLKSFSHNYYPNGLIKEQKNGSKTMLSRVDDNIDKYFSKSIPYQEEHIYKNMLCEDPIFLAYIGEFSELSSFMNMRFQKNPFNTLGSKGMSIDDIAYKMFNESSRLLLIMNQRYVVSLTRKYRNRGVEFSDLIMEGALGFLQGIRRYDPERNVRVTTFVHWSIKQYASRSAATGDRLIYVPFHITEVMNKIATIRTKLRADGIIPTNEQILFYLLDDRLKHIPQNLINTLDELEPYKTGQLDKWIEKSSEHKKVYQKVIYLFLAWIDNVKAFNLPYIEITDNPEAINFTGDVTSIDKADVLTRVLEDIRLWLNKEVCENAGDAYLEFVRRSEKRVTHTLKTSINKKYELDTIKIDDIVLYVDANRDSLKDRFEVVSEYL